MMRTPKSLVWFCFVLCATSARSDGSQGDLLEPRLGVVRLAGPNSSQPLTLSTHSLNAFALAAGAAQASITKLWKAGGGSPVRFVFATQAVFDDSDEIVVVREKSKKQSQLEFSLLASPSSLAVKKPKIIASFAVGALGSALGDGRVVALAAIEGSELSGVGRDEFAIVRTFQDGRQSLEIALLPFQKKTKSVTITGSIPEFGTVGSSEVIDIARVRSPIEGANDRLAIRRRDAVNEWLETRELPTTLGESLGPVLSSFVALPVDPTATIERMAPLAFPSAEGDCVEMLLLTLRTPDGVRRLEMMALPASVDSATPTFAPLDLELAQIGAGNALFLAFGLTRQLAEPPPPPPPPPSNIDLAGQYELWFQYSDPWSCPFYTGCAQNLALVPPGAAPLLGPIPGFYATFDTFTWYFAMKGTPASFLYDGYVVKPLVPDPYVKHKLDEIGEYAFYSAAVNGLPGFPEFGVIQFQFSEHARVKPLPAGGMVIAASVQGFVSPPDSVTFPLGYAIFLRKP